MIYQDANCVTKTQALEALVLVSHYAMPLRDNRRTTDVYAYVHVYMYQTVKKSDAGMFKRECHFLSCH